jgi:NAD+ synthase (glutamine-hydrolysing)
VLFPELGLSGYAIDDLLQQSALLEAVEQAVARCWTPAATWRRCCSSARRCASGGRLYNAALAIHRGRLLAAFPKTYLPSYREFYEKRHFATGAGSVPPTLRLAGQEAPFGTDILLRARPARPRDPCRGLRGCLGAGAALGRRGAGGRNVLLNLSASNVTVGKSAYRHALCQVHSARCIAAYLYSAAGQGESTTDLAWDGQAMIYENGALLAEAERFAAEPPLILADLDLERLQQERLRQTSFGDAADFHPPRRPFREVAFALARPRGRSRPDARRAALPLRADDDARLSSSATRPTTSSRTGCASGWRPRASSAS